MFHYSDVNNCLIHSADPQSRPVVIIVIIKQYLYKTIIVIIKQISSEKQCSPLARLWVWPSGSLMTPTCLVFSNFQKFKEPDLRDLGNLNSIQLINMRLSIILLAFILAFVLLANCEAGRRSGGGSRSRGSSSSRRRNNYGSSSSSNSGGFLRNIFKPKPKPKPKNPQSSYPRQTYGTNQNVGSGTNYNNNNNRGIGGGGFVNPSGGNANNRGIGGGGFVNPNKGGTSGGFGSNSNRGYGTLYDKQILLI